MKKWFEVILLEEALDFIYKRKESGKIILNQKKLIKCNNMAKKNKIKILDEVTEELIGKIVPPRRDGFELELRMDLIGETIKRARKERNLTQSELGELVGVKKAQISRLEKGTSNVTIGTMLKMFDALKAKVNFRIELMNQNLKII